MNCSCLAACCNFAAIEGWLNLGFLVKLKSFVYPFIAGFKNSSNNKNKKKKTPCISVSTKGIE
jgi:hypothetical protein